MSESKAIFVTRYGLRLLWIAVRLAAVFVFIREGATFVYQGF
jgi:hypothetical protein